MPLTLDAAQLPADAIEVGRIHDAWGIKGWFKVIAYSASAEALFCSKRWYLQPPERGDRHFAGTVLLRIREARERGLTVRAIADQLAAEGVVSRKGAPLHFTTVADILRGPRDAAA